MKKQGGFTVIEVSLFLAISASLIILTFGLASMVARQRFQDTMLSLRDLIQSQYEEVRHGIGAEYGATFNVGGIPGVNCTNSGVPGTNNCFIVGKLIRFSPNSSDIRMVYVIASYSGTKSLSEVTLSDMSLYYLDDANITGAGGSSVKPQTHQIQWGGTYVVGMSIPYNYAGASRTPNEFRIAILKDPLSGSMRVYPQVTLSGNKITLPVNGYDRNIILVIKNNQAGFNGAAVCILHSANSANLKLVVPMQNIDNSDNTQNEARNGCGLI